MKKTGLFMMVALLVFLTACMPSAETEQKTLTFWHIGIGKERTILEEAVKRFEEKHPDVKVEIVAHQNDAYKTKLPVAMGGGNPPDIFHSWGGGWLGEFVEAGQVYDLTDQVDADRFAPAALEAATFDGKIMGVPLAMDVVPVWYNKEVFEKYDIEPPETWDELMQVMETLKKNDVIPFALANKTKWTGAFYLMYLADRVGGEQVFQNAMDRKGSFDHPAYVKAGEYIQQLVKAGAFPEGFNGLDEDTGQSRQLFYSGKAAMYVMGSWFLNNIQDENPEMEKKVDFFPFPAVPDGKGDPSNLVGGVSPVYSISASCKYPDLAVELLKELTSEETVKPFAEHRGAIPALKGIEIDDESVQRLKEMVDQANYLQIYYDQTLPPELAEEHKNTTQSLFGLKMSPKEAAKAMEKKAKEQLDQ